MLRIIQNSAPDGAKSYYSTSDYYSEGQELIGVWRGKAAARLGLSGQVERPQWDALCDNRDPTTHETLTVRRKADRRVGYDFNFHVPKSVSLLYGLTRDERLLDVFRSAVNETMQDLESEMRARVRTEGRDEDRTTGNMVWGEFVHFTARPVDGVPDPHLHAHCFVFNTTWDHEESRWKAGQFGDLKRDAPYFEALFLSRLAHGLSALGLPIERTPKGWELAGLTKATLDKFSRRTKEIEAKAKALGITDPEAKDELGAKTRSRKDKHLSLDELRDLWAARLSDEETGSVRSLAARIGGAKTVTSERTLEEAVTLAIDHCFERSSVVPERTLLAEAMKRAAGSTAPELVVEEVARRKLIAAERGGKRCVTTPEVLAEERRMLTFARSGRGTCAPLAPGPHAFERDWMNEGQRRAVRHVLGCPDRVILIRGAAGTGKTSMMQEAVAAIEKTGTRVFAFAPSADASRGVLRSEGFSTADTVARLLADPSMQEEVRRQVIWIDEAGLLSTRTTAAVFDLAERVGARLVLSGDRRQHGSVERGASLRLLEEEAGLVPSEIKEIQRQRGEYKQAVEALSQGHVSEGFDRLNQLGWIREIDDEHRYEALAADYVATIAAGKSALVVSPTHAEGDRVTDAIRVKLFATGRLRGEEVVIESLEAESLTEAERRDAANYAAGDVLVYHRNGKHHERGERVVVGTEPLPLDDAGSFQLYHPERLSLAVGDQVRITRNGTTVDGKHRLNNGATYAVRGFDVDGNLVLENGWAVGKNFGHLAYGYCVTSHAAQGKTVDRVFIGQSAESFRASSKEQVYVSVSRGREKATLYTDDKESLLAAVHQSDDRITATELVRDRAAVMQRLQEQRHTKECASERTHEREERAYG